jgi:putative ABC transport system substrate-binding protein
MLTRRRFLLTSLAGALAAPRAAKTQQARKVHHIGFLPAGASPAHRQQFDALREGLRELGYVEGKKIVIWPKTPGELPELAASLVKAGRGANCCAASPAVAALKRVTQTIPIVFAVAAVPHPPAQPLSRVRVHAGCQGPTRYGRIISLSSCSTM